MRWLITGGCGFIGANLAARLLKEDLTCRIRILDNFSTGSSFNLHEACGKSISGSRMELVQADARDPRACIENSEGMDAIVHLAASAGVSQSVDDPRRDMETNVISTFNMLEAARQNCVKGFIFASSGASTGDTEPPVNEEKPPRPISPYGAGKLAGEGYCSAFFRTYGLKTVALRFGNVYGPYSGHKNSVVAKFFRQALSNQLLEVNGDGTQTRDFIYVHDITEAIILSIKGEVGGEVFQIATCRETSINELVSKIKSLVENETGNEVKINYRSSLKGDMKRSFADISKAKKTLGFSPQYQLEEGLMKTFEYFKKESGRDYSRFLSWV
ncbi:MAG: GDP-mannose 4,6-dehydratase [Deltaproteobacteria bacterium]|nr:GDP-mannose 4,6-dehydratase [Deltaproteobacteria bacterium]